MQIDRLDARILEALRGDARLSFRSVAKRVGATTPTVAARVRALESASVIRGYRAVLAPAEGEVAYVFSVRTRPADARRTVAALEGLPGVVDVTLLAGGTLHARVHATEEGLRALHGAMGAIDAILGYEHARVLDATPPALLPIGGGAAVACHTCGGPVSGEGVRRKIGDRSHVFCCRVCASTMEDRYAKLASKR